MSASFAGLAGTAITTIGTVAIANEVGKTIRSYSKPRRAKARKTRGKKK